MSDMKMWSRVMGNCEAFGGGHVKGKKHEPIKYDVATVIEAAEAYIEAHWSYAELARLYAGRLLTDEEHGRYEVRYAEDTDTYEALRLVCKAVGADTEAVLAVVRSFRRYSQYQRGWDFVAEWHMGERERDGFRRCVQA